MNEKRQEAIQIIKDVFAKTENKIIENFCLNLFPISISKEPY